MIFVAKIRVFQIAGSESPPQKKIIGNKTKEFGK